MRWSKALKSRCVPLSALQISQSAGLANVSLCLLLFKSNNQERLKSKGKALSAVKIQLFDPTKTSSLSWGEDNLLGVVALPDSGDQLWPCVLCCLYGVCRLVWTEGGRDVRWSGRKHAVSASCEPAAPFLNVKIKPLAPAYLYGLSEILSPVTHMLIIIRAFKWI